MGRWNVLRRLLVCYFRVGLFALPAVVQLHQLGEPQELYMDVSQCMMFYKSVCLHMFGALYMQPTNHGSLRIFMHKRVHGADHYGN
jgi:hypothetical protein